MISHKRLEEQMKRINFYHKGWGHTEVEELCNILMPDEEVEECVNGWYEAGFALLVATVSRVLLVDKKPLGYLTVEDLRFDMINELDLHHRLIGAQIRISAGNKTLHFTSLNQPRLRRLLNFVQSRMIQIKQDQKKEQETQKQHLEEMNEQLRLYLMAAHKQQFVDQAQAIERGVGYPDAVPPVAALYGPDLPKNPESDRVKPTEPTSPFEKVASQAFDNTQTSQPTPMPRPAVPLEPRNRLSGLAQTTGHVLITPQELGLAAVRRVVPIVSAYTRLPKMSRRQLPNRRPTSPEATI